MAGCSDCESTWTGAAMAHCAVCHNTYSTVSNFDKHIVLAKDGTICHRLPEKVGLVQNSRGTWTMPDERDLSELHKSRGKK